MTGARESASRLRWRCSDRWPVLRSRSARTSRPTRPARPYWPNGSIPKAPIRRWRQLPPHRGDHHRQPSMENGEGGILSPPFRQELLAGCGATSGGLTTSWRIIWLPFPAVDHPYLPADLGLIVGLCHHQSHHSRERTSATALSSPPGGRYGPILQQASRSALPRIAFAP